MTIITSPSIDVWLDRLRDCGDALVDPGEPIEFDFGEIQRLIEPDLVWRAQQFFSIYLTQIGATMLHGVLPNSFAAARGVQVVYMSHVFQDDPAARLRETTNFLFRLFAPAYDEYAAAKSKGETTLHPGRPGAAAALNVRNNHSKARTIINTKVGLWDARKAYFEDTDPGGPPLGKPLNQEDLLGMLLECTVGVFEGLDLLGVPYSDHDKRAWFHSWDIVGRYLGVCTVDALGREDEGRFTSAAKLKASGDATELGFLPDLCPPFLPLDVDRSTLFLAEIRRRHHQPSFEGKMLTNVLLAELQQPLSWDLKPFPRSLVRYLVGDEVADMLGVSPGGWVEHWISQFRGIPRLRRLVMHSRLGWPVRAAMVEVSSRSTRDIINAYTNSGKLNRPYATP